MKYSFPLTLSEIDLLNNDPTEKFALYFNSIERVQVDASNVINNRIEFFGPLGLDEPFYIKPLNKKAAKIHVRLPEKEITKLKENPVKQYDVRLGESVFGRISAMDIVNDTEVTIELSEEVLNLVEAYSYKPETVTASINKQLTDEKGCK